MGIVQKWTDMGHFQHYESAQNYYVTLPTKCSGFFYVKDKVQSKSKFGVILVSRK